MHGDEFRSRDKLVRALAQFSDVHLVSQDHDNPRLVHLGVSLTERERSRDNQRALALTMRQEVYNIDREHSTVVAYPKGVHLNVHATPAHLQLLATELAAKVYAKPIGMRMRLGMAVRDLASGLPRGLVDLTIVMNGRVDGLDRAETITKTVNGPARAAPPFLSVAASHTNVLPKMGASTLTVTARFTGMGGTNR